uniref:Uncharacterized protein n=1 Tax=uncultured Armatimonadetes bacterium TaxID=157466 RepID=A0A6J4IW09_9BACT|nr:hypothetical protein AVDCRST_MAG63-2418 [uncultured Armatimonadetes bacterium]
MRTVGTALALTILFAIGTLIGCARTSPAVGVWNGIHLPPMVGRVTLTLNADGKGFAKIGPLPEQPVVWVEENNKVTLTLSSAQGRKAGVQPASTAGASFVGTLTEDGRTMTMDLGLATITLQKQAK